MKDGKYQLLLLYFFVYCIRSIIGSENMKNKGFTLIELLAVVVIIGLIVVLIISKVNPAIKDSKESVSLASTNNLISALEEYYFSAKMSSIFTGCSYDFDANINTCSGFYFTGEKPTSGEIILNRDGVISGTIVFDEYTYHILNNAIVSD